MCSFTIYGAIHIVPRQLLLTSWPEPKPKSGGLVFPSKNFDSCDLQSEGFDVVNGAVVFSKFSGLFWQSD